MGGVLRMLLGDFLLQFDGSLVVAIVSVSNGMFTGCRIEEVFVDSLAVEVGMLMDQGMLEVLFVRQVVLNGLFMEFVVLVPQSLHIVLLVRKVSLSLLAVDNAQSGLVVFAILVSKRRPQVTRVAKVLRDSISVVLVVLVCECLVVNTSILEFLESGLPLGSQSLMKLVQLDELLVPLLMNLRVLDLVLMGVGGRHGCLRNRWRIRSRVLVSSGGGSTSLEIFQIFSSLKIHGLKLTSFKRRVRTSFHVRVYKLSGQELIVSFTNFEFRIHIEGSKGSSQCRGAKESDSKESEFGCVLHDVLVTRDWIGLKITCVKFEREVKEMF
jgi:hypothetical protein